MRLPIGFAGIAARPRDAPPALGIAPGGASPSAPLPPRDSPLWESCPGGFDPPRPVEMGPVGIEGLGIASAGGRALGNGSAAVFPERGARRVPGAAPGIAAPSARPSPRASRPFPSPSLPAGLLGFPPGPIPKNPAFSVLLSPPQKAIPARPRRRGLASLLHMLFGPPRLRAPLQAERDLALAIARCALDDSERVHVRILQTIYRRLTRSPLGCPRYGAHWEELGFQGADPGTDLRGTGMLGLLQMLHFVTDPRTLPLARKIFKLSQHETQHFPFCVVSVNVTRIVVRALRDERLSRECNRRRQVLAVLNDVYVGAFLRLYGAWTARRGALPDAGALLKLETFTKKKPRQLLKALESYLSGSAAAPAGAREDRDFTGICDLPAEAADAVRPL
uniref:ELMO domain containing 3 n=1 Tax=Nothoprocta perdicaria TaxID=30464 RepID=A0A8C6YY12_NOTPE